VEKRDSLAIHIQVLPKNASASTAPGGGGIFKNTYRRGWLL
jgi:hypothetical protein